MCTNGEALQIIGGSVNPENDVHGLRGVVGVNPYAKLDVLATLEYIAGTSSRIANNDVAEAHRREGTFAFRLSLARRKGSVALQEE
jgi:hypothetical protein